jgi:transmembrane sensor
MMKDPHNDIRESAIDWVMRLNENGFDDWDGFAAWLEADPARLPVYNDAVAALEAADAVLSSVPRPAPTLLVAQPPAPRGWHRRAAAGGLVAAAIVGAVGWSLSGPRAAPYVLETKPGEHSTVSIGTATIALNGGTRLVLDRNDPHRVTLDRGEALFDVRHDDAHPFTLHVGQDEVVDVGTRFDVTRDATATRVAVAEGMVIYNPRGEGVRLGAGQILDTADGQTELRVASVAAADVGGWREQRLSYRQARLATVAADLSRGLGLPIAVTPDVAAQPFTGVIAYGGDRDRFIAGLGPLLDASVKTGQPNGLVIGKAEPRR